MCLCLCVSFGHGYSDNYADDVNVFLADVLPQSFLSCLSAAVCSDPITFGHVELNAGSDWVIILSA